MDPKNAIELRNVSLTYTVEVEDTEKKSRFKRSKIKTENHVLDELDLDVRKGEILGIIGTNGAGKSTLLSIMARILEPDLGTVEIDGKVATILELGMGFHQDLSGRENIILKGELYGFSKKQMESKVEEIIDYSGIRRYIDNPVRTYSSGMRSRLAFSIMIHVDAEIMLVDEILSTGDAAFSAKASDFFKKILKDGKTVVYVSHSPGSIESICTRAIWLDKGKIIADGKPKKIVAQYKEATINSIDIIMDQARSGLADAQYRLSLAYKNGLELEQDLDAYCYWLELSAEQGHIKAQVEFADYLMESDPINNLQTALMYYQSSASRGDATAKVRMSAIMGKENIRKEYAEVKYIFEYLALQEKPLDMYRYGNFLLKTAWDEDDRKDAFKWIKKVSDEYNHPDGLLLLATMYRDGIGTKKNKKKYIETLVKGHELGIIKMTNLLADVYAAGTMLEENQAEALRLYEECAEKGVVACQYAVAIRYKDGIGVEPDEEKSKYWFDQYSKSIIAPFQLAAIGVLKVNEVPNSSSIDTLFNEIFESRDTKASIELAKYIYKSKNPNKDLIEQDLYSRLSKIYGKGMNLALAYYSSTNTDSYNRLKSIELLEKLRYVGNVDQLYLLATLCLEDDDEKIKMQGVEYMKKAAQWGHVKAIDYFNN